MKRLEVTLYIDFDEEYTNEENIKLSLCNNIDENINATVSRVDLIDVKEV